MQCTYSRAEITRKVIQYDKYVFNLKRLQHVYYYNIVLYERDLDCIELKFTKRIIKTLYLMYNMHAHARTYTRSARAHTLRHIQSLYTVYGICVFYDLFSIKTYVILSFQEL